MCLNLAGHRGFGLSIDLFDASFIGRIAQNSTLLCNTLHKPHAYWGITRIDETDIILDFVQRVLIIIDEKTERFA
jgi:hypothetical protein